MKNLAVMLIGLCAIGVGAQNQPADPARAKAPPQESAEAARAARAARNAQIKADVSAHAAEMRATSQRRSKPAKEAASK